ncbi:hypothetical protein AB0D08_07480 [Kitasatospora sp. NPDC048540]|uniref:hypothetical protein n=1 Tax=unclassified Kitasatospora TaxID=2633591 RepID=UPI00053A6457|nr:hypothetical protein [Kitasatospora sp. MBT63]
MRCPDHRATTAADADPADGTPGDGCPECEEWQRAAARLRELAGQAPGPSESWTGGLMARLDEALAAAPQETPAEGQSGGPCSAG